MENETRATRGEVFPSFERPTLKEVTDKYLRDGGELQVFEARNGKMFARVAMDMDKSIYPLDENGEEYAPDWDTDKILDGLSKRKVKQYILFGKVGRLVVLIENGNGN